MAKSVARDERSFQYDVCLSFAGEDRRYVRAVARALTAIGVRVFFDEYEEAELWGKDLFAHLDDMYSNAARYCVLFVSRHYAKKLWTNHERQSAQARAIKEHAEYILPARFDETAIPGLRHTVHFIDLRRTTPKRLAGLLGDKLGDRQRKSYFPPHPDKLLRRLNIRGRRAQIVAIARAQRFYETLMRMSEAERRVLFAVFLHGCPAELPENVHVHLDLLRRVTELPPSKVLRLLRGVSSLGIEVSVGPMGSHPPEEGLDLVKIEWWDRSTDDDEYGNATDVANEIIMGATDGFCPEHGLENLNRLDFSQLATITTGRDEHTTVEHKLPNKRVKRTAAEKAER